MKKKLLYKNLYQPGNSDYEIYLRTNDLFACQTDFHQLCNGDELQFQLVHQIEELLMKLIICSLIDINESMEKCETNKVISLFKRVHLCQISILNTLDFLSTMSPKNYQEIRKKLGRGSGRDSPGFKIILGLFSPLWETYKTYYLEKNNMTIEQIYDYDFTHCDAYVVAENLLEFDALFQQFLAKHMQVIGRSIGCESKSLSGKDVRRLNNRLEKKYFPELWKIRSDMTDRWGKEHGYVRDQINEG